jgi:alkaline phosphatase
VKAAETTDYKAASKTVTVTVTPKKQSISLVNKIKKQLTITPFSNIVKSGKKGQDEIRLNSVVVYVDKNNTFYLPASLVDFLK